MIHTEYYPHDSEQNKVIGDFVSCGIWGEPDRLEKYLTMAVIENGQLIAGTVYHNWYPEDGVMELSSFSLSKRWLTKKVIRAMFTLPAINCPFPILLKPHGMT